MTQTVSASLPSSHGPPASLPLAKADELPRFVTHLKCADTLEIDFAGEDVVNVDGEALFTDRVRMRMLPKALKLIVPKGMRFFDVPEA